LGLKVLVGWPVDISFGLEELLSFVLNFAIEVIMENTNAGSFLKKACGWCGNALLRRSGDYFPIQARDGLTLKFIPAKSERREVRFLPSSPF
jgi:hypothetical protein